MGGLKAPSSHSPIGAWFFNMNLGGIQALPASLDPELGKEGMACD